MLAHIRRGNVAGIGQKPPNLCGVFACNPCHAVIDGRTMLPGLTRRELDADYVLPALCRTLAVVSQELGL